MKMLYLLLLSALLTASCSSSSRVAFTSENDHVIWVYGIDGYETQALCGILSKGKTATTYTEQKAKLNPNGKVMWTEYLGADTSYFHDAQNPAHKASDVILPKRHRRCSGDVTFVFQRDGTWRLDDNEMKPKVANH